MSRRIFPDDNDPRHGTSNGYQNCGCRCADCREAGVAYIRSIQRKRNRECERCGAEIDFRTRGELCRECWLSDTRKDCPSASHYNAGCRCEPCKALMARRMANWRRTGSAA